MIINTYDQLKAAVKAGIISKQQAVAVAYHPRPSGRMGAASCDQAVVFSPFFRTHDNPNEAHWSDYGNKAFLGNREKSVPVAVQWATKHFGITEWKGNRWGDKVPAIVQKKFPIPK